MKKMKSHYKFSSFIILLIIIISCKKQNDWLDTKSIKSYVVPETLDDFQALMDNSQVFNTSSTAGLVGSDNSYLTDVNYNSSAQENRNLYVWAKEIWITENAPNHWDNSFKIIEYANVVLDGLIKLKGSGYEYNNVNGEALFHRALAYYNLAQLFCKPYDKMSISDLGLPLRKTSDVNEIFPRSSLSQTYQQIIQDASSASELLPESQIYLQRPIKAAAYALLAKTYLNMDDYKNAEVYADKYLKLKPQLLDFNNDQLVNLTNIYRFPVYGKDNPEVVFYAESNQFRQVIPSTSNKGLVLMDLYNSYEENDLRKIFFYQKVATDVKFRGGYSGSFSNFTGLATNEIYLIRAECRARNGNPISAMQDLNLLLQHRYKSGTYNSKTINNPDDALITVLEERRKELPFTGNIRWEDLRRLNKETRFQKTLTRLINGTSYTLIPNDKRYVLPIPTQEIRLAGIQQNER
ncbi:RagB/SusD family nutrient uptake outer membrane protein [Pedobacter sp.]|uniref:RagB/SusD family nutrient uptake outer membrane protein n=1 Tax=Pedobacter sp. TaxID=1411316 RepID=UPI002BA52BC6|nr:RagB/SusD family nutrient uptake outer membrane protein [Pedobacter sp.]HWW40151.1 RagB/SusD family nutrient uptake outer membrane protein [Pedobacter sp.]